MQDNRFTISFMFSITIIILAIVMEGNWNLILMSSILALIGGLIGIFWEYSTIHQYAQWNCPWNPITNIKEKYRNHKYANETEWKKLFKKNPSKAIKIYNKITGIPFWKYDLKRFVIVIILFLIFLFGILSIYYGD